ncbi:zinc finger protein DZIP1L [Pseudomyrmex gracilis]|uniref:zinc finger protein DZIP1L n=1 Tax=Pseudomyrmex gracilis TaxID=219809 RepID=UPI00099524E8|nr:zinc finger protein DZIP1L [Pseudomyrmex gracilis]
MAFSFRAGTNWCHDFPKLAKESGFYFNMHGSRVRVDWNRISAIDIDRVIHERDFWTIDENINNVIDYCLENEYDTKILDPNFVKLFRLAQLSVEYLLYCKQYLDHSVIILKDELRQKIEQNVSMKKEIATLEDTVKSLKEKSKEKRKLLETSVSEISNGEIYKCPHCPKAFVRAIFVNAHIARKHSYISDMGVTVSPVHEHYRAETEKLHNEIKTLKERLNQTERVIRNESDRLLDNTEKRYLKNTSQTESDIGKLDRFEDQKRYQEDIGSLRNILFDEIRALREKDHTSLNESIFETNIKSLLRQQEKEIESLRNQLLERLTPGMENMQIKLQTQENYWKAKIKDMEAQHNNDIERLTAELKATQQITDRIKSEYAVKVHDLEKQSMDQSHILVEQRKQLNSLSREISNTQPQITNYKTKGKNWEEDHESSLLEVKLNTTYNDSEINRKNLSGIRNTEMMIEDVDNESSQEYSDKLMSHNDKDDVKTKDNRKFTANFNRAKEHAFERSNLKNSSMKSKLVGKPKDKSKRYNTLNDANEITDRTSNNFTINENIISRQNNNHADVRSTEKKNMKNSRIPKVLSKYTESSITESESPSSISESESDSESITADNSVTVKQSPAIKKISVQEDAQSMFDNRLRELGIDPEWQGISIATYKQKMEIIRHQQNITAKKLSQYIQIKQKILEDVLRKLSANHKKLKYDTLTTNSPSNKLVTHVRSKTVKVINHEDEGNKSNQKAQNTTPSKLRLNQKIELLPQKYKDKKLFENTPHESPLKINKVQTDVLISPKVSLTHARLIRNISSSSSVESQEDVKTQISSTKIIVSDTARKASSPINRKLITAPKFSDNDSNTIVHQDSLVSSKYNKGVLKPTSASDGSLIKKKVLFDLDDENTTVLKSDQGKDQIHDFSSLSFPERRENTLQKEKSLSTGNIVLKTSQSDKIAEISKKIQEQLNIARKPPVGSVETIFRSTSSSQDLTNFNLTNNLSNQSMNSHISETHVYKFISPKPSDSALPQPAPRTLKDNNIAPRENKFKYSDLDSDIDEILQIE